LRINSAGLTSATGTFSVTGVSTLTGGAVIEGLTVGLGAGAVNNNTAVGASALASNTTGAQNTAVGQLTLTGNLNGVSNTAVGCVALASNNSGSQNTAMGNLAGYSNTTGSNNLAIGASALYSNTAYSGNTAIGALAMYSANGSSNNTVIGFSAGTTAYGGTNTLLGYSSGSAVTSGANNVVIGSYTGAAAPISATGSNYIVLSDGAGTVRQTIDPSGNAQFPTGAVVVYAPAPASFAALATLTNADLQTQLIVTTGTTFTLTMPLGSTLDTLISWSGNDLGYDFSVINTASGTITMAANTGVTLVGGATVLTVVSARFRIRRTAASTYILYRIG